MRLYSVAIWVLFVLLSFSAFGSSTSNTFGKLEISNDYIGKDDVTQIKIDKSISDTNFYVCFEYPVQSQYVKITKLNKGILFNLLKQDLRQEKDLKANRECSDSFVLSAKQELDFQAEYIGFGVIKYNITIYDDNNNEVIKLDPYMIGSLAQSDYIKLYMPFNNNITNVFSVQTLSITGATIRYNETGEVYCVGGCTGDEANYHDGSWSTYSYNPTGGDWWHYYTKKSLDTGAIWQVSVGVTSFCNSLFNISIPSDCFNYYTDEILLRTYHINGYGYNTVYFYCYNGGWSEMFTLGYCGEGQISSFFEEGLYLTNQTGYSYTTQGNVSTAYFDTLNLSAVYPYTITRNLIDLGKNKINGSQIDNPNSDVTINGLVLNGTQTINITTANLLRNTFTVATKINFNNITPLQYIIHSYAPSGFNNNVDFFVYQGILSAVVYDNNYIVNTFRKYYDFLGPISTNVYYTLFLTWNGSDLRLYVNNVEKTRSVVSDSAVKINDVVRHNVIGSSGTGTYYTNATISWLAIYNYTLPNITRTSINNQYRDEVNIINETNTSFNFTQNDVIYINNITINSPLPYSIAFWFYSNATTVTGWLPILSNLNQTIVSLYDGNIYVNSTGIGRTSTTGLAKNTWYHITIVEQSVGTYIYVNSVFNASSVYYNNLTKGNLIIGQNPSYVLGSRILLDELLIYDKALSPSEIGVLYNGYSQVGTDDCSHYTNEFMNFTIFNEEITSNQLVSNIEYDLQVWLNGNKAGTLNQSNSYTGQSTYRLCFANYGNNNVSYDIYLKYTTPSGFTHRYIAKNQSFNNISQGVNGGNYNQTDLTSKLVVTVRNKRSYQIMKNIYGRLQRYYVGEGSYINVQWDKTTEYGTLIYDIREADTDYRIQFFDENGRIISTSNELKFTCTNYLCEIQYLLDNSTTEISDAIIINSHFYNNSGIVEVNWSDVTGKTIQVRTLVQLMKVNQSLQICNVTTIGSSGSYHCDISAYNGTFLVTVYNTASPEKPIWASYVNYFKGINLYQLLGRQQAAFLSWGFLLTVTMFGIFSPMGAIICMIFGLVVLSALGIITFVSTVVIILVTLIAIIIGIRVRQ